MAHLLDVIQVNTALSANPSSFSFTCNSGATGLVVTLAAPTVRSGSALTAGGVTMTQVDVNRDATESTLQMWWLKNPAVNTALAIIVPNSSAVTMQLFTASFKAPLGYTSDLDVSTGQVATAAVPSLSITPTRSGCFIMDRIGHGTNALTTQSGNQTQFGTAAVGSSWGTDHGTWVSMRQYTLGNGNVAVPFRWLGAPSDDFCWVIAAFRETVAAVEFPSGGVAAGGSAVSAATYVETATGGLAAVGDATTVWQPISVAGPDLLWTKRRYMGAVQAVPAPAGGAQTYSHTAAGGVAAAGDAGIVASLVEVASGGLTAAGASGTGVVVIELATGGLAAAGTSSQVGNFIELASGGLATSGTAQAILGVVELSAGGLAAGGNAGVVLGAVELASGGLAGAGDAPQVVGVVEAASGGLSAAGAASVVFTAADLPPGNTVGGRDLLGVRRRYFGAVQAPVIETQVFSYTASGGAVAAGQGGVVFQVTVLAVGALAAGGTPGQGATLVELAVGGLTAAGNAGVVVTAVEIASGGVAASGAVSQTGGFVELAGGGLAAGGVSLAILTAVEVAAGNLATSGSAGAVAAVVESAAGGIAANGTSGQALTAVELASGGLAAAGDASVTFTPTGATFSHVASGGIAAAGNAGVVFVLIELAFGGAAGNGTAGQAVGVVELASGGLASAGTGGVIFVAEVLATGGLAANGATSGSVAVVEIASGGLAAGGIAGGAVTLVEPGAGGVAAAGAVGNNFLAVELVSGGAAASGVATVTFTPALTPPVPVSGRDLLWIRKRYLGAAILGAITYAHTASGGLAASGAAVVETTHVFTATGNLAAKWDAVAVVQYVAAVSAAGITAGGVSDHHPTFSHRPSGLTWLTDQIAWTWSGAVDFYDVKWDTTPGGQANTYTVDGSVPSAFVRNFIPAASCPGIFYYRVYARVISPPTSTPVAAESWLPVGVFGVVAAGAPNQVVTVVEQASGGLAAGGTAVVSFEIPTPAVTLSGRDLLWLHRRYLGAAALRVGEAVTYSYVASGGVVAAGTALTPIYVYVASGGVAAGGAATVVSTTQPNIYAYVASGGIAAAGATDHHPSFAHRSPGVNHATALLQWDWSQGSGGPVDFFDIKWGPTPGTYPNTYSVDGTQTSAFVRNFIPANEPPAIYYAVVYARNITSGSSPASNEIWLPVGVFGVFTGGAEARIHAPVVGGGIATGGVAITTIHYAIRGAGRLAAAGDAIVSTFINSAFTHIASGGGAAGGDALQAVTIVELVTGGVAAGGAEVQTVVAAVLAAGGVATAGDAAVTFLQAANVFSYTATGGADTGGSGSVVLAVVELASGGVAGAGQVATGALLVELAAGGVQAAGDGVSETIHVGPVSGGATTGGEAAVQAFNVPATYVHAATGGIAAEGNAGIALVAVVLTVGNLVAGGVGASAAVYVGQVTGGLAAGGAAGIVVSVAARGQDGAAGSGTAGIVAKIVEIPTGGLASAGSANIALVATEPIVGGVTTGGAAVGPVGFALLATGGAAADGIAASEVTHIGQASGGVTTGGAGLAPIYTHAASGGVATGGAATTAYLSSYNLYSHAASGGLVAEGISAVAVALSHPALGGGTADGAAAAAVQFVELADGGLLAAGTAADIYLSAEFISRPPPLALWIRTDIVAGPWAVATDVVAVTPGAPRVTDVTADYASVTADMV